MRLLQDGAQAAWLSLLRFLEIRSEGESLPQRAVCPFCRQTSLLIFDDSASRTQWHSCSACSRSGDLVDLAAGVWDLAIEATLARLRDHGLLQESDDFERSRTYLAEKAAYGRLAELVRKASLRSATWWAMGKARTLLSLGLRTRVTIEQWRSHMSPLVGLVDAAGCNDTFGRKLFRGEEWSDIAVVPFWTLPNRLSGVGLLGKDGAPKHRLWRRAPGLGKDADFGLAGVDVAWRSHPKLDAFVVGVANLATLLRVHLRHARIGDRSPPLVAWHDSDQGRTRPGSWQALGRRPVLLCGRLGWKELRQAAENDAFIAFHQSPALTSKDELPVLERMARVIHDALPWRKALARWLELASQSEVEELIRPLAEEPEPWINHVLALPRVQNLLRERRLARCVIWDGVRWFEDEQGWRTNKRHVTDYVLRLDELRVQGTVGRFHGRVLKNGTEAHFTVAASDIQDRPKAALREIERSAMLQGHGLIETQIPPNKLFTLAKKFKPWRTVYDQGSESV
jgi:hypothetical protein